MVIGSGFDATISSLSQPEYGMMVTVRSEQVCFGGTIGVYSHPSKEIGAEMKFSAYVPPAAKERRLPVLYFLAGLTCTEETFMIKAGALRLAAELGLIVVAPDTSPRGLGLPGEDDNWDFGTGAGAVRRERAVSSAPVHESKERLIPCCRYANRCQAVGGQFPAGARQPSHHRSSASECGRTVPCWLQPEDRGVALPGRRGAGSRQGAF